MNEIKQLRERLQELDDLYWRYTAADIQHWKWEYITEIYEIVDVLNLLDPCWIDNLSIHSYWIKDLAETR